MSQQQTEKEVVELQEGYVNDSYKKTMLALFLLIVLACSLGFAIFYVLVTPHHDRYFSIDKNNHITGSVPLNEKNMSKQSIFQFVNQVAIQSHTMNYVQYLSELNALTQYFTFNGFSEFKDALAQDDFLNMIINQKLNTLVVPMSPPKLVRSMVLKGHYVWEVSEEISVYFRGARANNSVKLKLHFLVQRVPWNIAATGIAISRYKESVVNG